MNKKIIVGIVVVLVILVLAVVGQLNNSKNIKIGAILPLTGSLAYTGEVAKTALAIAEEDYKDANISLVIENDAFTPTGAVAGFNKLIQVDKVVAVIGPLNGSAIESVRSIAVQNKTVAFTPYGGGNDIGEYLYKNAVEAIDEATAIANKAKELGYKRIAVMYLQTDMGNRYMKEFRNIYKGDFGELVAEEGSSVGETDYRSALSKIKEKKPDAIFIIHNSAPTGMIIKQAVELGIESRFFNIFGAESPEILAIAGKNLDGMIYTSLINSSSLSEKQKDFIERFKAKTGQDPQIVAYNIYDIYAILVKAIDDCGPDNICINNHLKNLREYDGVSGKFSIIDGKLVRDFYFKTIKDGQFVPVE